MCAMIGETSWEPTEQDIAWQENMIRLLKNRAVWGVPANQSAFKIDKIDKTFQLIGGDPTNETNRRIAKVFTLLNYTQLPMPDKATINNNTDTTTPHTEGER